MNTTEQNQTKCGAIFAIKIKSQQSYLSSIFATMGTALCHIWKPWPINKVDRQLQGGVGIMLDDLLAAIYSLLSLHIVVWSAQYI